jgi:hypothetical protein
MKALVKWSAFCVATGRRARLHVNPDDWFDIGDDAGLDYGAKLAGYQKLADRHFDTERYHEFCAAALPDIDDQVLDWVSSSEFDDMLLDTVRATYPVHEHDKFIAHFRGLIDLWLSDESAQLRV